MVILVLDYETEDFIQYKYYPEGRMEVYGTVLFNKKTGRDESYEFASGDEWGIFAEKAFIGIFKMYKAGKFLPEYQVAWC